MIYLSVLYFIMSVFSLYLLYENRNLKKQRELYKALAKSLIINNEMEKNNDREPDWHVESDFR